MKLFFKCFCTTLFMCTVNNSFTQSHEFFYAFNADWSAATSIDACTYFMHEIKKSDTEYVCRYYNKFGPMIRQECFKDSTLSIPNGFFCWYNSKGKIDSSGWVLNFKKDGRWDYFLGDSINPTYYDDYDNGKYIGRKSYSSISKPDSTEKDSTQKEAVFGKGVKDWTKYIERNLKVPDRIASGFKAGTYTVTVSFTIDKIGKIVNIYLKKSVEWSADESVFNLLNNAPDWKPAIQKGKPVYYRQQQNISMNLVNN